MPQEMIPPTPAEAERLHLLMEECGEVIKAASKVLRHGWESHHPAFPHAHTNRQTLEIESAHVRFAIDLLVENDDMNAGTIASATMEKAQTISQWLHYEHMLPDYIDAEQDASR